MYHREQAAPDKQNWPTAARALDRADRAAGQPSGGPASLLPPLVHYLSRKSPSYPALPSSPLLVPGNPVSLRRQAQGGTCGHGRSRYHPWSVISPVWSRLGRDKQLAPHRAHPWSIPGPSTSFLSNSYSPFSSHTPM